MIRIAIDPGKNGAIVCSIDKEKPIKTKVVAVYKMPETPKDFLETLKKMKRAQECVCFLEKVHSQPKNGAKASFTFGQRYGWLEMALIALEIQTITITPQKWQKHYELGVRGNRTHTEWKNVLKSKAQQLFPKIKVNLRNADALLILRYGETLKF